MKYHITAPVITRDLTIGNVAATPPRMDWPAVELDANKIAAWFAATIFPDGVNPPVILNDAGAWTVEDASGSGIAGWGDGISYALHFLQVTVRRKTGYAGAIAGNQLALVSVPQYSATVNTGTGVFTTGVLHGLRVGDAVQVSATSLPGSISAATDYFVIASGFTATAVKLSATRGGAAIVPGTAGTGVYIKPGRRELGRLSIGAAGAGTYEPATVPFLWYGPTPQHNWGGTLELSFSDPAAAANLTVEVQAAGEN